MKTPLTVVFLLLFSCITVAGPFKEFALSPSDNPQEMPDIDGLTVVWQEYWNAYGDYDVFMIDVNDLQTSKYFFAWYDNQTRPQVSGNWIVFQDDEYGLEDHDILLADISDRDNTLVYRIAGSFDNETNPAIHGNTMVWQSNDESLQTPDWDIWGADIVDPNYPFLFAVDTYTTNQQSPAIYRNRVVYEDFSTANKNIWAADIWMRNGVLYDPIATDVDIDQQQPSISEDLVVWHEPSTSGDNDIYLLDLSKKGAIPKALITHPANQQYPDIAGHLVVWQDDRGGNWDIYGYNLITGQEFTITDDIADQIRPAISGTTVVWEDTWSGVSNIWAAYLTGDVIADCPIMLEGDINGDCRVDMTDLAQLAANWMICNLDPLTACIN